MNRIIQGEINSFESWSSFTNCYHFRDSRYSDRRDRRESRDRNGYRERDSSRSRYSSRDSDDQGSDVLYTRHRHNGERKHTKFGEEEDTNGESIKIKSIVENGEGNGHSGGKKERIGAIGGALRGVSSSVAAVIKNFKAVVHKKDTVAGKSYCFNCGIAGHDGQVSAPSMAYILKEVILF